MKENGSPELTRLGFRFQACLSPAAWGGESMTGRGLLALIRITGWFTSLSCPRPQHWLEHWASDGVLTRTPSFFLGAAKYTQLESRCCHLKWQQNIPASSDLAQAESVRALGRSVGALAREGFQEEMTLSKISRL